MLVGWLTVFNAELSPKRYRRGQSSQEVGEEGMVVGEEGMEVGEEGDSTLSPPE